MKVVVSCLCIEEFYMTHTESSRFVSLLEKSALMRTARLMNSSAKGFKW